MTNILLTAYCACSLCCGPHSAAGLTASGQRPSQGLTIAGPRNVPLHTKVKITTADGAVFIREVQDRTARRYDGRWDLFFSNHKTAQNFGRKTITNIQILK